MPISRTISTANSSASTEIIFVRTFMNSFVPDSARRTNVHQSCFSETLKVTSEEFELRHGWTPADVNPFTLEMAPAEERSAYATRPQAAWLRPDCFASFKWRCDFSINIDGSSF